MRMTRKRHKRGWMTMQTGGRIYVIIAERPVPDSEPVPVQRGDGAFISSGFSPECISLCVVVSESKAH